jgi:hypothetical protein
MKTRKMIPVAVLAAVVVLFMGAAFSWPDPFNGKPDFKPGKDFGYFIWHDHFGWNVAPSTSGQEHVFSGDIKSNSQIWIGVKRPLGRGEFIRKEGNTVLRFRLLVAGEDEGFTFGTKGSKATFHLHIDGQEVATDKVFLGAGKTNPKENPFSAEIPSLIW